MNKIVAGWVVLLVLAIALPIWPGNASVRKPATSPTFYRDVLPILQQHCQLCHRSGEIAPMPLVTYRQTRVWAAAIRDDVRGKKMPPWFADPGFERFSTDPSLAPQEIETLTAWVDAGAPAGDPHDAPVSPPWREGWNIPQQPELVFQMSKPVEIPAHGDVEYTYEIVPTGFKEDKWVQMAQVRPSSRAHVHHAVVYIRPPSSSWLRPAPLGMPFTATSLGDPKLQHDAHSTDCDMLLVYAPGSSPDHWPKGMAKFIPAGSDLVFQMHYTTNGHRSTDQSRVGVVFAKQPVNQRVLTLQLNGGGGPPIPPGAENFRVEVHGTLPQDATLLSLFPHMHLRGKRFEYNIVHPDGTRETLLRVKYDFYWQLSYRLAQPRFLKAGTELEAVAWFDNSRNNRHNPDADAFVEWGDQTWNEMMVGFFDVGVPASVDKWHFFIRDHKP